MEDIYGQATLIMPTSLEERDAILMAGQLGIIGQKLMILARASPRRFTRLMEQPCMQAMRNGLEGVSVLIDHFPEILDLAATVPCCISNEKSPTPSPKGASPERAAPTPVKEKRKKRGAATAARKAIAAVTGGVTKRAAAAPKREGPGRPPKHDHQVIYVIRMKMYEKEDLSLKAAAKKANQVVAAEMRQQAPGCGWSSSSDEETEAAAQQSARKQTRGKKGAGMKLTESTLRKRVVKITKMTWSEIVKETAPAVEAALQRYSMSSCAGGEAAEEPAWEVPHSQEEEEEDIDDAMEEEEEEDIEEAIAVVREMERTPSPCPSPAAAEAGAVEAACPATRLALPCLVKIKLEKQGKYYEENDGEDAGDDDDDAATVDGDAISGPKSEPLELSMGFSPLCGRSPASQDIWGGASAAAPRGVAYKALMQNSQDVNMEMAWYVPRF